MQVSNKSPGAESYIQLFPARQEIKGFLETTDKIMNLDSQATCYKMTPRIIYSLLNIAHASEAAREDGEDLHIFSRIK